MRYTLAKIMSWRPCYSRKQVRRLMGRKRSVTLIDILCCDDLPDADAVWAATRTMGTRNNRLFACDCAESVLHLAADPRCAKAIRVARRFADGLATADELRAAWAAAYAVPAATANDSWSWHSAKASAYAATCTDYAAAWAVKVAAYAYAAYDAYASYAAGAVPDVYADQRQALLMLALAGEIGKARHRTKSLRE